MNEPIAIVGMSCRFPKAPNVDAYWKLLVEGGDAISEVPANRFDLEKYYDSQPATAGRVATRWGGFLDHIEDFDAEFFAIAPREADWLDPQQRLLLEVGWEALEDAGIDVRKAAGSSTGVFVGLWLSDYEARLFANPAKVDFYMTTGSGRYAASGRVSYALGLEGPSLTVDTACSSSLVAVHLACQSLRAGECTTALAGASNVILQPHITIAYSQSRMMAPDGQCKFGDARANGYVRSEGAAMLVLKTVSQAEADGDVVYAVIRGSAVNNDGQSSGYLATPGQSGQVDLLHKAYENAGVVPGHVRYVEAHGTGTRAGDPIELGALGAVLAEGRKPDSKCVVGSVKTNIGHTEGAAGLAGLIKTVLILKNHTIPASLHFQEPNPQIPWSQIPVEIRPYLSYLEDSDEPIIAGVSAFGITGTNAHIVLEEAPQREPNRSNHRHETVLIPLSAKRHDALVAYAQRYHELDSDLDLHDVAFTASTRRTHHELRLAVVAQAWDDLRERLAAFADGDILRGVAVSPQNPPAMHKIAFVFSGQGGQWPGMGRRLMDQEPIFRAALERCEAALKALTDWSLLAELNAPEGQSRLDEINVIQPTIFAIQVALAELWRSWGIEPDAVIGHSMGEVAAACVAGVLSLEDAARVICHRSQLMKRLSGQGAMALVELSYSEAEAVVAEFGFADRLGVAVSNGPSSTVLSGDPSALQEVVDQLESQGVFCRFVKVDVAAHSPHMDALRPLLVDALRGIQTCSSEVPVFSTVTGQRLDGDQFDAAYWGQNLRQPVRFATAVENALDEGFNTFIEFSPHPVLLSAIDRGYGDGAALITLPSMRRDEDERSTMLESLGTLYASGYAVDWTRLYPDGGNLVRLPAYPWQKERFWYSDSATYEVGMGAPGANSHDGHPLLGQHLQAHSGTHYWQTEIDLAALPYLADHQVQGRIVFPAAGYAEMALAAATSVMEKGHYQLHQLVFEEALFLSADEPTTVQMTLTSGSSDKAVFAIHVRQGDTWSLHARGTIIATAELDPATSEQAALVQARLGDMTDSSKPYGHMARRRLGYGPTFRGISRLAAQNGESFAALGLHEAVRDDRSGYQVHPALLDACFQLLLAALPEDDQGTYLPVDLGHLTFYERPAVSEPLYAYARLTSNPAGMVLGNVLLQDESGRVLIAVADLRMKRLEQQASALDDWLYEVRWLPVEMGAALSAVPPGRWLVFADSQGLGGALISQLKAMGEQVIMVSAGDDYRSAADSYVIDPMSPGDFERLAQESAAASHTDWRGVIYLWALDEASEDLPGSSYRGTTGALHLTQMLITSGLSPRLWLVTCGAQPVTGTAVAPAQSSLWGFGAVLSNEHPELHPVRVDLDPEDLTIEGLLHELWMEQGEDQVAYRGQQRYAARLSALPTDQDMGELCVVKPGEQPFRAEVTRPGVLENLRFRAMVRQTPGPGEVEIEVMATGLNFMNVMSALGIYPGYENGVGPLGIECAGRVVRVGEGVDEWQVGDEVVAMAFDALATHVTADAQLVARKPGSLSFEEAATIPIAFLTAYYALDHLARLQGAERVLIHAGAGGVGQAAIQLAQRAGAEVWATAGTPEKRDLLRSMGVYGVMDSRSLAFADDILAATDGEGVDVVLNSLAGEAIARGLEILRPYGRFVELGKRDIYDNNSVGLLPFSKNLAYFAVDLDRMARERPAVVGAMLREIVALVADGELRPLPVTLFSGSQVVDAFRYMAQGRHTGKIVITPQSGDVPVFMPSSSPVRGDASYLITGGLGGLGLTVMHWLAEQGAGQIVLVARHEPGEQALAEIEAARVAGVDVQTVRCDVTDPAAVEQLVADVQQRLLPLRGVFHAAGLLDDTMMLQLDPARLNKVMSPKVAGAWNLHTATRNRELDWFVLFSSVAAVLGTPGQANYASGNAFMDGLAHYRRDQGLAALSINWGPWSDVGLAAAQANGASALRRAVSAAFCRRRGWLHLSGC